MGRSVVHTEITVKILILVLHCFAAGKLFCASSETCFYNSSIDVDVLFPLQSQGNSK